MLAFLNTLFTAMKKFLLVFGSELGVKWKKFKNKFFLLQYSKI